MVGASASECDTIPGRQCMASCFFLLKLFDDVLVFLSSIKVRGEDWRSGGGDQEPGLLNDQIN